MNTLLNSILILATVGSGIVAGIFFIFSNTVMRSLSELPQGQGHLAMQSINQVILNGGFFTVFFGTGILHAIALGLTWFGGEGQQVGWILLSALCYIVGNIAVTGLFNVPLNNQLEATVATSSEGRETWSRYLRQWLAWNHLRTLASLASAVASSFILLQI